MSKRILVSLVILLVASAAVAGGVRRVVFKGKDLRDEQMGIAVMANETKEIVVVSSPVYHFAQILPYSEEWEFTQSQEHLLMGSAGLVNLTLDAYRSDQTPEAFLAATRKRLETTPAGKGVTKIELTSFKGQPALRDEQDAGAFEPKFKGVKVVHYFGAKRWQDALYTVHLSVVVDPKGPPLDDRKFLSFVTVGLSADFMRD